MLPPHGIEFAAHLISSFYGDLCSKVCECLLRRGTQTLAQIVQFTQLTKENVINCLRVLIHQNCVQAFTTQRDGDFRETPSISTQYMALPDNVIHKLRASKFIQIVSEELGKDCLEIFHRLIQHGRLSFKEIIESREVATSGSSDTQIIRESFNKLLNARFIERCPIPDPYIAPLSEEKAPPKKRGAKSSKVAVRPQSIEERALEAARPKESMRFLMEMGEITENSDVESIQSATLGKRKQDVLKSDEYVPDKKKEVLWRVNCEEFLRRLRNKVCISYVKTRINDEAGIVLSAILDLDVPSETRLGTGKTGSLSINAIYDEVIKKKGGLGMDFERIRVSLEQLGCNILSQGLDESFSIDIKNIIEMAQTEEVESVILKRYGREAYRIFRLLSKSGRLIETDKISDSAFVDKKETLKILNKLWKDQYVHMERVTSTGAARTTYFMLCKVDKAVISEQFLDEMYHAALNLRLRLAHELEQGREVLLLPREKLVGELKQKYYNLLRVRNILESSLINLDDSIMLFHDF